MGSCTSQQQVVEGTFVEKKPTPEPDQHHVQVEAKAESPNDARDSSPDTRWRPPSIVANKEPTYSQEETYDQDLVSSRAVDEHPLINETKEDVVPTSQSPDITDQHKSNTELQQHQDNSSKAVVHDDNTFTSYVSYPPLKLCEKRVYHLLHVSKDGRKMFNASGSDIGGSFKWYSGTCSSTSIPVKNNSEEPNQNPESQNSNQYHGPLYWECHSFIKIQSLVKGWHPLIEMGLYQQSGLNKQYARGIADQTGPSWAVRVAHCKEHKCVCTQVWESGEQVEECFRDTLKYVVHNEVEFKFGIVLDVQRGRVAFIDLEQYIVLNKFDVEFTESLVPMFGMATGPHYYSIGSFLVSGQDIELTEDKIHLISEALS